MAEVIADLHLHSRFSRATSKNLDFFNLVKYAKIKGVGLLGTGDFTHPTWLNGIKELREEDGVYYYQDPQQSKILGTSNSHEIRGFPFIITGEISLMYTQKRGRRVHLVLLVPSIEIAEKINSWLDTKGRRDYDGRPIFKISCRDFTAKMKEIDDRIEVIPAHAWTPWFGVFGSNSGFDSLSEAFGDQVENIHAIETGLSSDPGMNYQLSELNNKTILSFSDLHSFWPWRIGREATIFDLPEKFTYQDIINAIREDKIIGTIEVDPAYGKYHWDGHRNCDFSCNPGKTKELGGKCPKCNKDLTVGVEYRVKELANQNIENRERKKKYYKLLPLHELIALAKATTMATKKAWDVYNPLIEKFGNEFNILLNVGKEDLMKALPEDEKLVNLILKNREGNIKVKPGYDGEYGEALMGEKQSTLF